MLRPPLDALMPRLVERDELRATSAISWSLVSIAGIIGRAIVWAAAGWGLFVAVFGLADTLWLALLFLALAGGVVVVAGCFALPAALPRFWNYDSRE